MILKLMVAGVVLYYLVLWWQFRKTPDKQPSEKPGKRLNEGAVIGKTTFTLRQVKPSEAIESQLPKPTHNDSIFAPADTEDTPQPMDVEFEMEYADEVRKEVFEAEEIALITGGAEHTARGISFEEMAQAVRVVGQSEAPETEERQAVQTLSVMQQSSLYDKMIEQINGGRLRVAEMLGKYDYVFASPDTGTTPEDLGAFDMNDYM